MGCILKSGGLHSRLALGAVLAIWQLPKAKAIIRNANPFLWLFFSGFSYMSILSFADMKLFRRLAMEEPADDAQSASNFVQ